MTAAAKLSEYPSLPAQRRALRTARKLGLDPVAIEVAPGGVIRVIDRAAFPASAPPATGNTVDDWFANDAAGSEANPAGNENRDRHPPRR